jgi:hypothetical protein
MTTSTVPSSSALGLAQRVADQFAAVAQVEAVVLAGSRTLPFADAQSDVDLYVYGSEIISLATRAGVARHASRAEIGNCSWEPGDEWIDGETGISVDIMFRTMRWIEDQLDRSLLRHAASVGYSTCFWYNVRNSQPLFDRSGWFGAVKTRAGRPYPEELRRAILAKYYPILRTNMSSYLHQIALAMQRDDSVSVNHRVTAMLASYFDILFAVNRQPHPGEKRLLRFAQELCPKLPAGMAEHVTALLSALPGGPVIARANAMLDDLDDLLRGEGLLGW